MDTQPMVVDLVRNLRHELRTPVNHIVGFAEMLQEEAADRCWDALLPDLERIRDVGRGMADFIASTVDIAKVEAGRLDPAQISRDFRTPLESVIGYSQLLQEIAEERDWHAALPDLTKIESAAKYLTGLIQAVLDLAVVYGKDGARPARATAPDEMPRPVTDGRLLLVDDNELDAEMLGRRLTQAGYDVSFASNGHTAIELMSQGSFDAVLIDVLMPDPDGFATLRAMKASEGLRNVPAIMISAVDEVPIVVRCIEMGADDYLIKPVDAVLLRAKVGSALEKARLRRHEQEYMGHVTTVTSAAAALEAGSYEAGSLGDVAAREDSLGRLARVFERMALELRAREESLQQQLSELRIEIDEVKLARDLAAITGAEYFEDVKRRSQRLRLQRDQWRDGGRATP